MHAEFPLSEIAQVNPGRPRLSLEPQTEVSFIPMSDVTDSGRWDNRQVRKYQDVRKGYTCFENRDVLFAKITPCMENGKGCLVDGVENNVGFGSTEFHVLRAKANADPGFIYQWSIHRPLRLKAAASMTGSAGQQRVPASFFEAFMIPQMNNAEQTRVAEILSTVDQAIEQTEALIAKQQRIKTGLIENLLTRGIDEQGNLRSEETHRFKDSPLGRIPVEWQINELFDLVSIAEGQKDPREEPYCDWPLVAPDCVESGTGRLLRLATAREQQAISGKYEFAPGSVLYSKIRPHLRKAVLVDFAGLCSADMYPMRPTSKSVSGFIFLTILSKRFSRYAESVSVRSGFPKINRSELGGFLAAAPLVPEQERISAISDELAIASDIEMRNLSKLRSLKTALMQDLLTGRVRVTPLLNDTEVMGE